MFQYKKEIIVNPEVSIAAELSSLDPSVGEGKILLAIPNEDVPTEVMLMSTAPIINENVVKNVEITYYEEPHVGGMVVSDTIFNGTEDLQVRFTVKIDKEVDASIANSLSFFAKEYVLSIPAKCTKEQFVSSLKAHGNMYPFIINPYNHTSPELYLKNPYMNIVNVSVEKFVLKPNCNAIGDWTPDTTATNKITVSEGSHGFGTYAQLMSASRLSTVENLRFSAIEGLFMPRKGQHYTLFRFNVESGLRNIGGSGVVGEKGTSFVTIDVWVCETREGEMFGALDDLGINYIYTNSAMVAVPASLAETKPTE